MSYIKKSTYIAPCLRYVEMQSNELLLNDSAKTKTFRLNRNTQEGVSAEESLSRDISSNIGGSDDNPWNEEW